MGRPPRIDIGEQVYHVINRANGRATIFHNDADYSDFEYLLREMAETFDTRILAYVVMPNHWHLLLYPKEDGYLSKALQWLGTTHARRHHARKDTVGNGHLYQGRYKSSLIEDDTHFLTVLKYIERNPVRANLVSRAEEWRWGSAHRRLADTLEKRKLLAELPVDLPKDYVQWVNEADPAEALKGIRQAINKGVPYGREGLE
jgi:putative transposase